MTLRAVRGTPGVHPGRRLGGGSYDLAASGEATVTIELAGRAAKLARRGRLRRLEVVLKSGDPAAPTVESRVLKLNPV
jgi:hypothetical protein